MARPHVILHILQSIDGRVAGSFMGKASGLVGEYAAIRRALAADSVIYGATTAAQLLAYGRIDRNLFEGQSVPEGDYVADSGGFVLAIIDPDGTLGFESGFGVRGDMEGHIVELLREDVDQAYLAYLRSVGVSYILAGRGSFDAAVALEKLGGLFGRRRALLMGGGYADGTLAAAGCIDELSLVVAPVAEVASGSPALFETMPGTDARPLACELEEVRSLAHSGLWLHYSVRGR